MINMPYRTNIHFWLSGQGFTFAAHLTCSYKYLQIIEG
jgi:hypothetical protein